MTMENATMTEWAIDIVKNGWTMKHWSDVEQYAFVVADAVLDADECKLVISEIIKIRTGR